MLAVDGLVKRFALARGTAPAVRGVGFTVREGEFFTLLGPSGCGKTTTLRCVAGLETPDEGVIRIGGDPVYDAAGGIDVPVYRRDIAMVFQSYAIWPHMTVAENVAFPLEALRVAAAERPPRVAAALDLVGLSALADRPATQLSGGQQQRVAFARAIAKGAKLLLLDEPLSNLDARLRVQMRTELRALQRRLGTTAIYVTHDQEEALSLSDRIAVMRDGLIIELGAPRELYMRPQAAFTASFIGQADLVPARILAREGAGAVIDTPLGRLHAATAVEGAAGEAALLIRPEHVEIVTGPPEGNTVEGRVESLMFSGRYVELEVLCGTHRLKVQAPAMVAAVEGDAIRLRLPPERCVVLRREAS